MNEVVEVKVVALAIVDADGKWHSAVADGWGDRVSFFGVRGSDGICRTWNGPASDAEGWAGGVPGVKYGEKGVNMEVVTYSKGD